MNDDLRGDVIAPKSVFLIIGLLLGVGCIVGGIILAMSGINGNSSGAAAFIGLSTNINDAIPGSFVLALGIAVVWMTRFKRADKPEGNA